MVSGVHMHHLPRLTRPSSLVLFLLYWLYFWCNSTVTWASSCCCLIVLLFSLCFVCAVYELQVHNMVLNKRNTMLFSLRRLFVTLILIVWLLACRATPIGPVTVSAPDTPSQPNTCTPVTRGSAGMAVDRRLQDMDMEEGKMQQHMTETEKNKQTTTVLHLSLQCSLSEEQSRRAQHQHQILPQVPGVTPACVHWDVAAGGHVKLTCLSGQQRWWYLCLYQQQMLPSVHHQRVSLWSDMELECFSLRSFYLQGEFWNILLFTVSVPPSGRAATTVADCLNRQLKHTPEVLRFVLADFNHCKLEALLPGFYEVDCNTRGKNIRTHVWECWKSLNSKG